MDNGYHQLNNIKEEEFIKNPVLVRLMIQALHDLGYEKSAMMLQEESDVPLESRSISVFRKAVLNGDWKSIESLLPELKIQSPENLRHLKFLLGQQRYLELLESKKLEEAVECLRNDLTPLSQDPKRLHQLSSLMMCLERDELLAKASWDGAGGQSRHNLLSELRNYVSPSLLLPERRLKTLLWQAVKYQQTMCVYHNADDDNIDLFQDHVCDSNVIPRHTTQILDKHTDEVWVIQYSHDGRRLASGSRDTTAIIWDLNTMKPIHILKDHTKGVSCLSWSPNDGILLTGSDRLVRLFDTITGQCIKTFDYHKEAVTTCSWFPDGQHLVTGSKEEKYLFWLDIRGKEIKRWVCPNVIDATVTPDGNKIVCGSEVTKILIYDLRKDTVSEIKESDQIVSLNLSADGKTILVCTNLELHTWDIEKKLPQPLQRYKGHKRERFVIQCCFGGKNQSFILSGSEDNMVYMWHRQHENLIQVLGGHSAAVNSVCWNPQNIFQFASASDDHTIRLWSANKYSSSDCSVNSETNGKNAEA